MTIAQNAFLNLFCAVIVSCTAIATEGPIRILSIDGGGVRGIIPATILEKIESDVGKPIAEVFDMVAGTSIGGIIALILASPSKDGRPTSAEDVLKIAFVENERIFRKSFSHWWVNLGGLIGPKYQSDGIAELARDTFGEMRLSQTLIPALVTGYSVDGEHGVEFFSEDAKAHPLEKDCLVREIAMATSAAPTLFDSVDVHFPWGEIKSVADGAMYKNDPALIAYANARKLYPHREIEIYSLGTGKATAEMLTTDFKGRGMAQWASPIFSHLLIGGLDGDQTVLHKLLNSDENERYFRLNVRIDSKHKKLDDISGNNIVYLYSKGLEATTTPMYARMIEKLKRDHEPPLSDNNNAPSP